MASPLTRRWRQPRDSATISGSPSPSLLDGASCGFRPSMERRLSSATRRRIPSASTWVALPPAMRLVDEAGGSRPAQSSLPKAIHAISQAPPAPTWLFTLAAAAGAAALSVIFGVQHLEAVVL